jgi:hypothetical protein
MDSYYSMYFSLLIQFWHNFVVVKNVTNQKKYIFCIKFRFITEF